MVSEESLKWTSRESSRERVRERRADDLSAPRQHCTPEPAEERSAEDGCNDGREAEKRDEGVGRDIQHLDDRKLAIPLDESGQLAPTIELEVAESVRGVRGDDDDAGQHQQPRDL